MIAFESRASTVLFNFLKSNYSEKKYILPSNVCPVIPLVFLKAGCNIEFCDIDFETFCIDEDFISEMLIQSVTLYFPWIPRIIVLRKKARDREFKNDGERQISYFLM